MVTREPPKGIDDARAAGAPVEVLTGEAMRAALDEAASVADPALASARKAAAGLADCTPADVFDPDRGILDALAVLSERDAPRYARARAELKAAGVSLRDLDRCLKARASPAGSAVRDGYTPSGYVVREGQVFREVYSRECGLSYQLLANFHARIVEEVALDDGSGEDARFFVVEGALGKRHGGRVFPAVRVQVARFAGMGWVNEVWGSAPCVQAGQGSRDHLRAAIQDLSGADVPTRRVFRHLGWRQVGGGWIYLHAGGGIGPDGPEPGIEVDADGGGALSRFTLPDPPTGADLADAVRASLRILDVAARRVSVPVFAAIWRAALGSADFSLHLTGGTGRGKSELAALAQQHFGPGLDARHLPAAWSSTANALESLAFLAKDTLLTVDDFAPSGASGERERYHREAERFFRAVGNAAGRQRLNSEARHRADRPPRCLPLSTGEDLPGRLASLRARIVVVEVGPSDMDWSRLTDCQRDASAGLHAGALAGFLRWIAGRFGEVRAGLPAERDTLAEGMGVGTHKRTPRNAASLAVGLRWFLRFARDAGAIDAPATERLWSACLASLADAVAAQDQYQQGCDPAVRFLELLASALASGRAHVAAPNGEAPPSPGRWGWRSRQVGPGAYSGPEWQPQGRRVGWVEGDDLFLEPDAAYQIAQEAGAGSADALAVGNVTLWKRLKEAGALASVDSGRGKLQVRRTLEGVRRSVIHVCAGCLESPGENRPNRPADGIGDGSADPTDPAGPGNRPALGRLGGFASGTDPQESGAESAPGGPLGRKGLFSAPLPPDPTGTDCEAVTSRAEEAEPCAGGSGPTEAGIGPCARCGRTVRAGCGAELVDGAPVCGDCLAPWDVAGGSDRPEGG